MEGEGKRKENMEKYAVLETGGKQVLVKVESPGLVPASADISVR